MQYLVQKCVLYCPGRRKISFNSAVQPLAHRLESRFTFKGSALYSEWGFFPIHCPCVHFAPMNPAPKACCCTCWCAVQRVLAVLCFAEDRDELKYSSAGCKLSVVLLLTIPEAPCLWEKIVKKRDLYFKKKKKTGRFCPDWKSLGTARAGLQQMI